jgi:hypothetical protein
MYLSDGLSFEEAVDVFVLGLAALAVADQLGLFSKTRERTGLRLPGEAIDQADRGREVRTERPYGPDLKLTADLDEDS